MAAAYRSNKPWPKHKVQSYYYCSVDSSLGFMNCYKLGQFAHQLTAADVKKRFISPPFPVISRTDWLLYFSFWCFVIRITSRSHCLPLQFSVITIYYSLYRLRRYTSYITPNKMVVYTYYILDTAHPSKLDLFSGLCIHAIKVYVYIDVTAIYTDLQTFFNVQPFWWNEAI